MKNPAAKLMIKAIRAYQIYVSPSLAPCCKYIPTCSEYAIEAITLHGAFRGFLLAVWRIVRCNPFSRGGYDPVPPVKHPRRNS